MPRKKSSLSASPSPAAASSPFIDDTVEVFERIDDTGNSKTYRVGKTYDL
jgi:hypothetical protein